ncbi:hypothetical protein AB1Y20_013826 [Prymnesium parvum]|uniref:Hexosyltransferase n=1 Tax=Prymnesium parvum TaxID=97485 RepID=A0AB34IFJ6_PRYPA
MDPVSMHASRPSLSTRPSSSGVLMCVFFDAEPGRRVLDEAPIAAAQLKKVMSPPYPILLLANAKARSMLVRADARAVFDRSRELHLDRRILEFDRGTWRGVRYARPYLHKLSCLLQSDFNQTVFIDCDTFVVQPSLIHHMLTSVLAVADVAMPMDPGREAHLSIGSPPWISSSSSGPPPLCSALMAYSKSPIADALWLGAARRLLGRAHPEVRQGDQEMVWFEWTQGVGRSMRILPLPGMERMH